MRSIPLLLVVLALASLCLSYVVHADEQPASDPFQPGKQHEMLKKYVGTWDAEVIAMGMDGTEARTRGTLKKSASVNFNTVEDFKGEAFGTHFEGHGINGFCGARQQFFTLWTDSMTSTPLVLFGNYDEKSREIHLSGECFGMSGKLEPCRTVTQLTDDDHYSFEFYGAGPDGKEVRHLRIEYTRAK